MSSSQNDRASWEYASGPRVGSEVPITSPPRDEERPGIPSESPRESEASGRTARTTGSEVRMVQAADPALSPELNELLTRELREIVGTDEVRVPADRPHHSQGEGAPGRSALGHLNMHRWLILRMLLIALTFGAIISLITNDWWFLVLAVGLHALGTMGVTLTAIRMTTISEHPSPELGAALSEAGIASPDEYLSRLVDEFRPLQERGAGDVISPGYNERTASASAQPAQAGAEGSSAMTPTAEPSEPGGEGGAPDVLIWATALALLALSIVLPAVMGGSWMWLLTAVMIPLVAGWMFVQWLFRARGERVELQGPGPILTIALCTTVAVAAFCAVVAFGFQH